jgi:hypothetical protein
LNPFLYLFRNPPKTHEEWLKLLQHQQALHAQEMSKWQKVLQIAVELLKKVSVICEKISKNSTNIESVMIKDEL